MKEKIGKLGNIYLNKNFSSMEDTVKRIDILARDRRK